MILNITVIVFVGLPLFGIVKQLRAIHHEMQLARWERERKEAYGNRK